MASVTQQPTSGFPVTIRNVTLEDAAFVCRLQVEAFRSKYEHAVGKSKIPPTIEMLTKDFEYSECSFHRTFLAEYGGKPAGVVKVDFRDDKESQTGSSGCCAYLSAVGCGGFCGLMCMECCLGNDSLQQGECYIDYICVDEGFRGKGIGKSLMEKADQEARNKNCRVVTLMVADDNRAKNLYERQGFAVTETVDSCCIGCAVGKRGFFKMEKPLSG